MATTTHPAQPDHADPQNTPTVVLGVDTHRDVHVAAVLDHLGTLLDARSFPATADGYRRLLAWARTFGQVARAGVEGTGSFGAALTRYMRGESVQVVEVHQPNKALRRRRGKTDAVDAEAAARAVLSAQATAVPKAGDGHVEAMRIYKLARDSAVKSRSQAINQLKAVLVNADPALRESLAGLGTKTLIRTCAELPDPSPASTPAFAAAVHTLRLLARRIRQLSAEAYELEKQLRAAVLEHTPQLLERPGIGPDSAATLLITMGDNPERVRSQASFAALCGVSPVQASSGKTQRLRLNRGGDRQANAALYRIVLTRLRRHDPTRDYLERRTSQGKTRREIIRCLKYYVAREVYHLVRPQPDAAELTQAA
ncbi:IS110 family transposase [Microbispora hainanensis]|uniref:IS110 family transposase n=1 Tax=Microbispora hainanensis TaxID=568844 RepID=A0A544Y174_9ACTN|nr:IS110 family transposase [Microbispora hainanensis]